MWASSILKHQSIKSFFFHIPPPSSMKSTTFSGISSWCERGKKVRGVGNHDFSKHSMVEWNNFLKPKPSFDFPFDTLFRTIQCTPLFVFWSLHQKLAITCSISFANFIGSWKHDIAQFGNVKATLLISIFRDKERKCSTYPLILSSTIFLISSKKFLFLSTKISFDFQILTKPLLMSDAHHRHQLWLYVF